MVKTAARGKRWEEIKGVGLPLSLFPSFLATMITKETALWRAWGARVSQWWEHSPPSNLARVQIPASKPYAGWVCCWFSLCSERFLFGFPVFPSPQKPTLPNSNSIWNAWKRLDEFIRTPKCFGSKQNTITEPSELYLYLISSFLAWIWPDMSQGHKKAFCGIHLNN